MKKLCGCKEPCFVDGTKVWDRWGRVLCFHATEVARDNGSIGICGIDKKEVQYYGSAIQYEMAKHCYKCAHNTAKWLMICIKCKWFYDNGTGDKSLEDLFKEES